MMAQESGPGGRLPAADSPCESSNKIIAHHTIAGATVADCLLEGWTFFSSVDGVDHSLYIVPYRAMSGMVRLCRNSPHGVHSSFVQTVCPIRTGRVAEYIRDRVPGWAQSTFQHWAHAGCPVDPFDADIGMTGHWINGGGCH